MTGGNKQFPDFLVIGVPRAGTTWLHDALRQHPQVFVPSRRKEVHYFDRYYERGDDWYSKFFRGATSGQRVGEITPHYLYHQDSPQRIEALGSVRQLIVILRHPVERAVSHYRWRMRQDAYRGSFEQFLNDYPNSVSWGQYHTYLARFRSWLEQGRMLILVHERLFSSAQDELDRLSEFLDIDPGPLSAFPADDPVNRGHAPRFPRLWRLGARIGAYLRHTNLDWVVNAVRKLGLKRLLEAGKAQGMDIKRETRRRLEVHYESEIDNLAALTGMDFEIWRHAKTAGENRAHGYRAQS